MPKSTNNPRLATAGRESGSDWSAGPIVMERLGNIKDADRSFDIAFWQAHDATARFRAAWELVVFAHKIKGGDPDELRLDRTVGNLQRRPR